MSESSPHEEAIFARALELPPGERAEFLRRACAGDAALGRRLSELLRAHDAAGGFLEQPAAVGRPLESAPGERVGRYRLLEKLGEGGCGEVWMAGQAEPVHRRVALKVIKPGMDTKAVIARFDAERQALALMEHPNIAKVLDAGTTDAGRPYFVMELVRGIPLTQFCDESNASTTERLRLFIQVCHAVQHAHQKGIIHRDLKPTNILVTRHDDVAVPKVIDFGIAKATQGRLTDQTLFTAFEQFLGTPAYMSPEQAEFNALDVDTRSDIYSLGVLLYELLTGVLPFEPTLLAHAGLDEIRRIIREVEPPRPSTRLGTLDDAGRTTVARRRNIPPAQLVSALRGDLDWIVMRCLEKSRLRRYATAGDLAADIQRHLDHEPVTAAAPGSLYVLRKFARRHRTAFVIATSAAAMLALAAIAGTGLAVRAIRAEQLAQARLDAELTARAEADLQRRVAEERMRAEQEARREAEQQRGLAEQRLRAELAAREEAERERARTEQERNRALHAEEEQARLRTLAEDARAAAERSEHEALTAAARSSQVAQFMTDMLRSVGPRVALGRDTTLLHDLLDDTAARLAQDLSAQPEVEAELRTTLAAVYAELGDTERAIAARRDVLALQRRIHGDEHAAVAEALVGLGLSLRSDETETCLREALAMQRRLGDARVSGTMAALANFLDARGDVAQADALYAGALTHMREVKGNPTEDDFDLLMALGAWRLRRGRYAEAEGAFQTALDLLRAAGTEHSRNMIGVLTNLGHAAQRNLRYAVAERALREADAIVRTRFGANHPQRSGLLDTLGQLQQQQGDLGAAESLFRESEAMRREVFGHGHPALLPSLQAVARSIEARNAWKEAEPRWREAVEIARQHQRSPAPYLWRLARNLEQQNRRKESEALRDEARELARTSGDTTQMILSAETLRELERAREFADGPEPWSSIWHENIELRQLFGSRRPRSTTVSFEFDPGQQMRFAGRLNEAEAHYRTRLEQERTRTTVDRGALADALIGLGGVLASGDRLDEAERAAREALEVSREMLPGDPGRLIRALDQLRCTLGLRNEYEETEALFREALELRRYKYGVPPPEAAPDDADESSPKPAGP